MPSSHPTHPSHSIPRVLLCVGFLLTFSALLPAQEMREWTDATGAHKIQAKLIEVKEGYAFLENASGKTMKIAVSKLSKADQELLNASSSPFEMVDEASTGSASKGSSSSSPSSLWTSPKTIDWASVDEISLTPGTPWNVQVGANTFDFEPKRTPLQQKANFFENLSQAPVNTTCKRAALGFTVTFSVPKHLTRISLVDLVSGRSVHSEQIEANMQPLALMDNGSTILMKGGSDERGGFETGDQLQLWKLDGKKIVRTPSWVPHLDEKKSFGKTTNAAVGNAWPISNNLVLTLSNSARLVLWNIYQREPIWHANLNKQNFGVDVSFDRKHIAVFNDKTVLVLDAKSGETLGSTAITASRVGWNRIRWSPSGKKLLLSSVGDLRIVSVETGEVENEISLGAQPVATRGLAYPHEDFALLDNKLLVHLPSRIRVCEYTDGNIKTLGGKSFIALHGKSGGIFVPAQIPHPKAEETLQKAQDDPTLFLLHPGVSVGMDVSQVPGQYRQEVQAGLRKSIENSGFRFDSNAPIRAVAKISGPTQEAVSYIARGSYVVNQYNSNVQLMWNGKSIWSRGGNNIPGFLQTKSGETIKQALDRYGKKPNTSMFSSLKFPEFMQKPSETKNGARAASNALMSSKFTLSGLVDSN
ncbi:MAG: SHD1 domain-containing protein [Planctomycetota bacterium]